MRAICLQIKLGKSYKLRNSTPRTYHQVITKATAYNKSILSHSSDICSSPTWHLGMYNRYNISRKIARGKKERVTDQELFSFFTYKHFE